MKVILEADADMLDTFFVGELKEQHRLCCGEFTHPEDITYNKKMRKHLKAVLRHNMTPDEFKAWSKYKA